MKITQPLQSIFVDLLFIFLTAPHMSCHNQNPAKDLSEALWESR